MSTAPEPAASRFTPAEARPLAGRGGPPLPAPAELAQARSAGSSRSAASGHPDGVVGPARDGAAAHEDVPDRGSDAAGRACSRQRPFVGSTASACWGSAGDGAGTTSAVNVVAGSVTAARRTAAHTSVAVRRRGRARASVRRRGPRRRCVRGGARTPLNCPEAGSARESRPLRREHVSSGSAAACDGSSSSLSCPPAALQPRRRMRQIEVVARRAMAQVRAWELRHTSAATADLPTPARPPMETAAHRPVPGVLEVRPGRALRRESDVKGPG